MATKQRRKTEPPRASEVSRRRFLQSVIAASAATGAAAALTTGAGAPATTAACAAGAEAVSGFQVFTEAQAGLLAGVLNRLIPAEGAMPAAGDLGLTTYLDGVLADAAHLRQPILDVLSAVECHADVQSPEGLDGLLTSLERTHRDSFSLLLEAVYTGYYTHPKVLQAIGWVHPGDEADTSETLDLALLEDVVRRGPIYTNV